MKYLKWFYIATAILMCIGGISNIADGSFDIWQAWIIMALLAGIYITEEKK